MGRCAIVRGAFSISPNHSLDVTGLDERTDAGASKVNMIFREPVLHVLCDGCRAVSSELSFVTMLYEITIRWTSLRYDREFPTKRRNPINKFADLRDQLSARKIALPRLSDWSFVTEFDDLSEYRISARFVSPMHPKALEQLFETALIPGFCDRIEISSDHRTFAKIVAAN